MNIKETLQKMVGKIKQRKYAANTDKHCFKEQKMKQARVLKDKELDALFRYVATRKYAARDRAILACTYFFK